MQRNLEIKTKLTKREFSSIQAWAHIIVCASCSSSTILGLVHARALAFLRDTRSPIHVQRCMYEKRVDTLRETEEIRDFGV